MGQLNGKKTETRAIRLPKIAVIGSSSAEGKTLEIAEEMGGALAKEGWHLLCGGGGGVMEAACRGFLMARTTGPGMTIGILPTDEEKWANPYVEIAIPTGLGLARNALIAETADALVAIGGCSGTLSEIAFAWQKGRPIVAMTASGGWAKTLAGKAVDERRKDLIYPAQNTASAISFLRSKIEER
jgi:hypothetical protein